MGVGEQDAVKPTEPEPTLQQLALRALTTINQKPAVAMQDDERRQPSVDGRHTGGGAKKDDLEQAALAARTRFRKRIMTARLLIRKPGGWSGIARDRRCPLLVASV